MKRQSLSLPLISSCAIHLVVLLLASVLFRHGTLQRQNFVPISLIDFPRGEAPQRTPIVAPPVTSKTVIARNDKSETVKPLTRFDNAKIEPPATLPASIDREEQVKARDGSSAASMRNHAAPIAGSIARPEGGGSEAGAGNAFAKGDVAVVPGSATAGGGGGTATAGLGRGAGLPGLPAQQAILRTNREAKPIQTARAIYPAMALRAGLESDVALKIEVDPLGNVTKAEITKSGGPGFDEEALKAVKHSRFEAAQRDGQAVPAEFTFVYRFRLQR